MLLEDLTAGIKNRGLLLNDVALAGRKYRSNDSDPWSADLNMPIKINAIYNELNLSAENFTNACSVLMRVFSNLVSTTILTNTQCSTKARTPTGATFEACLQI